MRLIIVEDATALRESLRVLLGGEPGIELLAAAADAEAALAACRQQSPEVMLVDLGLPGMSGVELISEIKATWPEVEMMAFTVFDDKPTVFAAIKAGASGYLLKGCSPRELVEALHLLAAGGAPMTPKIARAVVRELQEGNAEADGLLTAREKEVLVGIERGLTYKEIAEQTCLSTHTVHTHIRKIYGKLQAAGRQDALARARRRGIL
jgi:DNA-binding NarL/FixJ family response regulator